MDADREDMSEIWEECHCSREFFAAMLASLTEGRHKVVWDGDIPYSVKVENG